MELSKKPSLVFFATQPGAMFKAPDVSTLDISRCHREVIMPARELLIRNGLVHQVVFVIVCDKNAEVSEVPKEALLRDEGLGHLETPTSREILTSMRGEWSRRSFEYLNISCWGDRPKLILDEAVSFARLQGADGVIVYLQGASFPTPQEFQEAVAHLEKNQVLVIPPVPAPA